MQYCCRGVACNALTTTACNVCIATGKLDLMEFCFRDRKEWRKWLEDNGSSSDGLWMINYKKHTGRQCIPYVEAVEEALCFGWIDGKIKRINDEYFIRRFTPRRPGSQWSKYNIERIENMIKEGKVKKAGLDAYNEIFKKPELMYDNRSSGDPEIPDDLLSALRGDESALSNFMNFSPSARKLYIGWLNSAKKAETRPGRILKIVEAAKQNRRPGMM
jgi:uncharacterized protein YdeI (YjbR/CyaY-like superfamily)